MKIKVLLSALAAAMLLLPNLYATSSHEGAVQGNSPTTAPPQTAPQRIGDQMQGLPDDTRALESAATTTDQAARPATATKAVTRDLSPTVTTATKPGTRDCVGCHDRQHRSHNPGREPAARGNGFGVAAMVFGILAITIGWAFVPAGFLFALLAVIFGGIGLGRGRGGKGMAIAGLVLGILTILLTVFAVALLVLVLL